MRAALAYGLLHAESAPRTVILSLLRDYSVISRAVLQYSPVLVDADLAPLVRRGEISDLLAIAQRKTLSARIVALILEADVRDVSLHLMRRVDITAPAEVLAVFAAHYSDDAQMSGALLARKGLPAQARLALIRAVAERLRTCRVVAGALPADRINKLLLDSLDTAVSVIGEASENSPDFVDDLVDADHLNTRTLLHALINGRVLFFADCIGHLAGVRADKVFSVLTTGSRATVSALFAHAGLAPALVGLMARFVEYARLTDLSEDVSARHYVVTAITEELLADYEGDIPLELEEAFGYLSEQNITLARQAARSVTAAFGLGGVGMSVLQGSDQNDVLKAYPAA